MQRALMKSLLLWKDDKDHKPLIIRGARQVGKSYLAREIGKEFKYFAELNFEENRNLAGLFDDNLDPDDLILKLSIALDTRIIPGETLLFFDEIQICPRAITSLRYFYEKKPDLHIVAAGSLIDFVLEEVGIPVGRVRSVYLYPLSFFEFMTATGNGNLIELLEKHNYEKPLERIFHTKLLDLLGQYMAVGGMPEAVKKWITAKDLNEVLRVHTDLLDTFQQDFNKYAKNNQIQYVDKVFKSIPGLLGRKFVYSMVDSDIRSRELKPAVELLQKAGILHTVTHTSANGMPLGAEKKASLFKAIFLDIALAQRFLGIQAGDWIIDAEKMFTNKGEITEAFVGQEILSCADPFIKKELFYWTREKKGSSAEVDYITDIKGKVIPVEVKSGTSRSHKSMRLFLGEKPLSTYGIHFSQRNFSVTDTIRHYPLYAVKTALHG